MANNKRSNLLDLKLLGQNVPLTEYDKYPGVFLNDCIKPNTVNFPHMSLLQPRMYNSNLLLYILATTFENHI